MQYKKLTRGQLATKSWQAKRNSLVAKLLEEDKFLRGAEALKIANKVMGSKAVWNRKSGGYEARNKKLTALGFDGYEEYLKSDEWSEIRSQKLSDEPNCCLCGKIADQVHHFSYEEEVLLGVVKDLLFSVCGECHGDIEFEGCRKRSLESAQRNLLAWFAVHDPQKADRIQDAYSKMKRMRRSSRKRKKKTPR